VKHLEAIANGRTVQLRRDDSSTHVLTFTVRFGETLDDPEARVTWDTVSAIGALVSRLLRSPQLLTPLTKK
jgi:hypothetical protein